jgi:hypothetical protein
MSDSTGETPQYNQSQTTKPGATPPPTTAETPNPGASEDYLPPPPSEETFLMINVREGASTEEIGEAVKEALRMYENPFFQYDTPLAAQARGDKKQSNSLPAGQALSMIVRTEGPKRPL